YERRVSKDRLLMFGQPGEGIDRRVDPTIEYPSSDAEPGPDDEVAGHKQEDEARRVAPSSDERREREHERDARGEHHRHDHQHPADAEEGGLDGDRPSPALVAEEGSVGRALPQP